MIRVKRHPSLITADKVLTALRKLLRERPLPANIKGGITAQCFDNCREQGYHLSIFLWRDTDGATPLHMAITQDRHSDQIVVYPEVEEDTHSSGTHWLPNKDGWTYRSYHNTPTQAAIRIRRLLMEHCKVQTEVSRV